MLAPEKSALPTASSRSRRRGGSRLRSCIDSDASAPYPASQFSAQPDGATFPSTSEHIYENGEVDNYDMLVFSCGFNYRRHQTDANIATLKTFRTKATASSPDHIALRWINTPDENAFRTPPSSAQTWRTSETTSGAIDAELPKGQRLKVALERECLDHASDRLSCKRRIHAPASTRPWLWLRISTTGQVGNFYVTINTPVGKIRHAALTPAGHQGRVHGPLRERRCRQALAATPFPGGAARLHGHHALKKKRRVHIFDLSSCV